MKVLHEAPLPSSAALSALFSSDVPFVASQMTSFGPASFPATYRNAFVVCSSSANLSVVCTRRQIGGHAALRLPFGVM